MSGYVVHDLWGSLKRRTPARIALGRSGAGLPTEEVLRFSLAHAKARDAVHMPLDAERLAGEIKAQGHEVLHARSAAADRATYLRRPDLGRCLSADSSASLTAHPGGADLLLVIADGLSAAAVHANASAFLAAFTPWVKAAGWTLAPVVIARQARVALGDEIGAMLKARAVAMLIGERPGLSSPDSLGVYLTLDPAPGRNDAQRNCLSNIRAEGMSAERGAFKLAWLVTEAFKRKMTGVALKDESDDLLLDGAPPRSGRLSRYSDVPRECTRMQEDPREGIPNGIDLGP